jgi:hypothetical protein
MSTTYPQATPTEEIRRLITIVTGKAPSDIKQAAKDGWVVQGYLQSLILGDVEDSVAKFKISAIGTPIKQKKLTNSEAVEMLKVLGGSRKAKEGVQAQGLIGDFIGGQLKGGIAKLLLPIILDWIKKWLAGGGLEKIIGDVTANGVTKAPKKKLPRKKKKLRRRN